MLRVTVLELPATWNSAPRVLDAVGRALARGPATDVVLLPETSLTGYVSPEGDFDLTRFAEPAGGPTAQAISALARRHGIVLVAPLVLREDDACFNVMLACGREGQLLFAYRKRHPWFPETWATAGTAPAPVIDVGGLRLTIAVCFDIHFLEEDAAGTLETADMLLFPSAWVEPEDTRSAMLPELARRHQVAIANANWGPGIVRVPGQGGSSIIGPDGAVLARTPGAPGAQPRTGGRSRRAAELSPGILRADAVVEVNRPRIRD